METKNKKIEKRGTKIKIKILEGLKSKQPIFLETTKYLSQF